MSATLTRPDPVTVGPLHINPWLRSVTLAGEPVKLSRMEYRMLLALARDPERCVSRLELFRELWGWDEDYVPHSRAMDSWAHRLRKKLGEPFVVNVWGEGYRLVEEWSR